MTSNGRKISKPKCVDVTKTYQYRAVVKFVDKATDLHLSKNEIEALVVEIVNYAKSKKLLSRGTAILNMANIFSICYSRIELSSQAFDRLVESIKLSHDLIKGHDLVCVEYLGGYPKLINLVNSGDIPIELIAISKQCLGALRTVGDHRHAIPSDIDLLKIRIKLLSGCTNFDTFKQIMGNDLASTGVPR